MPLRNLVRIGVTGISATGFHGVNEAERRDGQPFIVDVMAWLPHPTDELSSTVNYSELARVAHNLIQGEPFNLIETLAERIAANLLETWPTLTRVAITVHKPQAPIGVAFQDVSCRVRRSRRQYPVRPFVLSLGANLGDPPASLQAAVQALRQSPELMITAESDIYRTTPVEVPDPQPDYHNLVVLGRTALSPGRLLGLTSGIEQRLGRTRTTPHEARVIDIDIIRLGDVTLESPELTLPHPRAAQRAFVLVPWLQVDPDAELPAGRVAELLPAVHSSGVGRWH